eukprot:5614540-Prymnesium_polylepis.1
MLSADESSPAWKAALQGAEEVLQKQKRTAKRSGKLPERSKPERAKKPTQSSAAQSPPAAESSPKQLPRNKR